MTHADIEKHLSEILKDADITCEEEEALNDAISFLHCHEMQSARIAELEARLALVEPLVEEACRFVDEYEDSWSSDALDIVTTMLRFQVRRVREAREKRETDANGGD